MRLALEVVAVVAVAALSFRRLLFLVTALLRPRSLPPAAAEKEGVPTVAVLVPARNEGAAVERLLEALARLAYPRERRSFVFVGDGCSDDTLERFRAWAHGRAEARVVELPERRGKAAALNAGLALAESEIVVVLDADLRPAPDFLREIVRPFADPRVGAAAAYLHPANADETLVSRYAAVTTWVHQLVTSAGTDRLGLDPPTLGAAAYRRAALDAIGGIPMLPVGVDVATSAAMVRAGWRTRFVPTAVADNTVVSRVGDYWHQHVRWARGVLRLPGAGGATGVLTLSQRLAMAAAAIGYADRVVFAVAVAGALAGLLPAWVPLLYLAAPGLEIVAALLRAGIRRRLPWFLAASVVFFAIDLVASVSAVVTHAARRPYRWHHARHAAVAGDSSP